MATADEKDQEILTHEYKEAIKHAFHTYYNNIEEIFDYGCDPEVMKEDFLRECKEVLKDEEC